MFSIREVKKNARVDLKRNFFRNVLIVFMVGLITQGGYRFATDTRTALQQRASEIVTSTAPDQLRNLPGNLKAAGVDLSGNLSDSLGAIASKKTNFEILEDLVLSQDLFPVHLNPETTTEKYTRGVLSVFVNEATSSGSMTFGILNGINEIVFHGHVARSVIIFLMAVLTAFVFIFVKNVLQVGLKRYFLEHRRYLDTSADRIFHVYRVGKTLNVAKIMLLRYIRALLWMLTIVMGPVKYYEYRMIPYILAENPGISEADAFALSRQLTDGEKWRMFCLDWSLLGWRLLGLVTFNLTSVFYLRPYLETIHAELYMQLKEAKRAELVNGKQIDDAELNLLSPVASSYPEEQYLTSPLAERQWLMIREAEQQYSPTTYILFFFTFSFVGWVWEVSLHLAENGEFVNRGVLLGPWLPIYGFGGVLILLLLRPLRNRPWLLFLGSVAVCGTIEYFTAVFLEIVYHQEWWNYDGYFLNFQGRICLEGLLVFGLGGVAFTYVFAPILNNIYAWLSAGARRGICICLILLFVIDAVHSAFHPNVGEGITTVTETETEANESI